jgi:hypothetical protein
MWLAVSHLSRFTPKNARIWDTGLVPDPCVPPSKKDVARKGNVFFTSWEGFERECDGTHSPNLALDNAPKALSKVVSSKTKFVLQEQGKSYSQVPTLKINIANRCVKPLVLFAYTVLYSLGTTKI